MNFTPATLGGNNTWTGTNTFSTGSIYTGGGAYITATTSAFGWWNGSSTPWRCDSSGNSAQSGYCSATSYPGPSDKALKENILEISGALSKVKQLTGIYYNFIGNPTKRVGLIAQDVQPVIPEVVEMINNSTMGICYSDLVAVLIEAVKELEVRVAALEAK